MKCHRAILTPINSESATREYATWAVSFTQTLYLDPTLLEDPPGIPKFVRTWEVSNIDGTFNIHID
ncbi:hypothetical protein PMI21_04401 [Pseudomonas sp. GM18]|uniref:hypothetical protein n=1 Tax=Pseudomonas sp. GM18 TaxID=1144324 RepID=UPI0002724F45|nr:hypothetical protein [Pseudomonas sp. GM18]EJM13058.1 hypothetical protein PMI21_04401 [Pseudomonas sp. GM18]